MLQPALDADHMESPEEDPTPDPLPADIPADDTGKSQTPTFVPWKEERLPKEASSILQHQTIIKKEQVIPGKPMTITPEIPVNLELEEVEVTPILEGDRIVGIQVVCHCGATHEIRFEYNEPK